MKKVSTTKFIATVLVVLGVVAFGGLRATTTSAAPAADKRFAVVHCNRMGGLGATIQTLAFAASLGVSTVADVTNCAQTLADLRNIDRLKLQSADGADFGVVYLFADDDDDDDDDD